MNFLIRLMNGTVLNFLNMCECVGVSVGVRYVSILQQFKQEGSEPISLHMLSRARKMSQILNYFIHKMFDPFKKLKVTKPENICTYGKLSEVHRSNNIFKDLNI